MIKHSCLIPPPAIYAAIQFEIARIWKAPPPGAHDFPRGLIVIEMFIQLVQSPQNSSFFAPDLFKIPFFTIAHSCCAIFACFQPPSIVRGRQRWAPRLSENIKIVSNMNENESSGLIIEKT